MNFTLTATTRTERGTKACALLREAGKLPAVVYSDGKEADLITVDAKEFEKVWKEAGESTIFSLEGLKEKKSVLIQDVAVDALYDAPLHVDFYSVSTDKTVTVEVPLVFEGVAPAEKELGGTLIKVLRTIEIEALPKDLPKEITVDISTLKTFDDQIQVKDVALPAGVVATLEADEVVALVQAVQEEVEPEAPTDVASIEVEKKGKDEAEEGTTDEK